MSAAVPSLEESMSTIRRWITLIIALLALGLFAGCTATYSTTNLLSPQASSAHETERVPMKAVTDTPRAASSELASASLAESPLELSDVIKVALRDNPELLVANAQWLAAKEGPAQARSLENPVLGYGYFVRSIETKVGPQEHTIGLAQKFPFFGKLRLRGEVASREAERIRADYEAKKVEIVARAKATHYELYMAHKAIEITEENLEILRRFIRVATSKYAAGKVSQQDVLKAQVELSKLANELLILRQRKETAVATLNVLLNRSPEAPLGVPAEFVIAPVTWKAEELQREALGQSPVLRALQEDIEKGRARVALARRQYYPDFVAGVDYIVVGGGTTRSPEDGKDAVIFKVGITLPIWQGKLKAGEREAEKALEASVGRHDAVRSKVLFQVSDSLVKVQTTAKIVELYTTTLLPQAEQALKAATIAYEADRADFLNLLESQRALLTLRLGYYRALVDFQQRLAELERAVGGDLTGR